LKTTEERNENSFENREMDLWKTDLKSSIGLKYIKNFVIIYIVSKKEGWRR